MKKSKLVLFFMILWSTTFIILPIMILSVFAITNNSGQFTANNFLKILTYNQVILKSIFFATLTTLICLLIAYPFSYFVFKALKKNSQKFLIVLIIMPALSNILLRTFAWMTLLEKNGLINKLLKFMNLPTLKIINTPAAVVLVMIYDFLPFMILPIYASICKINSSIINASYDLGANEIQTFKRIILPLSIKGMFQGVGLVFVLSCSTFIVPRMMSGGTTILIGDLIESHFMGPIYNPWLGSALALSLNLTIIAIITITNKLKATKKGAAKNETEIFI